MCCFVYYIYQKTLLDCAPATSASDFPSTKFVSDLPRISMQDLCVVWGAGGHLGIQDCGWALLGKRAADTRSTVMVLSDPSYQIRSLQVGGESLVTPTHINREEQHFQRVSEYRVDVNCPRVEQRQ